MVRTELAVAAAPTDVYAKFFEIGRGGPRPALAGGGPSLPRIRQIRRRAGPNFRGSEARYIGCYLNRMRTRFDSLTIVFGLLILVAITAGVMA